MKRLFLIVLSWLAITASADVYTPQTVPFPRKTDAKAFVANPDNILSSEEQEAIQSVAEQLYQLTGVEMVTVALDDIGDAFAFDFTVELFNLWGIGDKKTNTGLLIFFTMEQHDIRITTGTGLEGLLTDATSYDIILNDIIPLLRQGQYGNGLLAGNQAVYKHLTSQRALEELLFGYQPKEPKEQPWKDLGIFAFFIAIVSLLAYWAAPRCPKCKKKGAKTRDEVIVYATFEAGGRGIHHHTCVSCGHKWDEPYTIPKKRERSSYSGSGSSSGGYSGGGGSYGGGSTSGGGAGSKW